MDDAEFAELAERTQQIVSLADTYAWQLFADRANAELVKHQRAVMSGNLDEKQYQRTCGWIQGAMALLAIPDQVQKELEHQALQRALDTAEEETVAA